jgi:hypothetical protein
VDRWEVMEGEECRVHNRGGRGTRMIHREGSGRVDNSIRVKDNGVGSSNDIAPIQV